MFFGNAKQVHRLSRTFRVRARRAQQTTRAKDARLARGVRDFYIRGSSAKPIALAAGSDKSCNLD